MKRGVQEDLASMLIVEQCETINPKCFLFTVLV